MAADDEKLSVRRSRLAAALLTDLEHLRTQLFAPVVQRKALVVSDGAALGSHVELIDIDLDEPTFEEKKTIITAIAVGVEKVLQLDQGGQQEGDDVDEVAKQRAARREAAAKLVASAAGGGVKRRPRGS